MAYKYPLSITALKGLRPVFGNNVGENIKRYLVLKELFAEGNAHFTFAEPSFVDGKIRWETELTGEVVPFPQLAPDIFDKAKRVLRYYLDTMYEDLKQYEDADALRQTLDNCLEIPDESCIFLVGRRPVLVNWGFLNDTLYAPKQILKNYILSIPTPKMMINLKTVEAGTQTPLSDVTLEVAFRRIQKTLQTNAEGNASFQQIQPFDHPVFQIQATKKGFESSQKTLKSEHTVADIIFNGNFPLIHVLNLKPLPKVDLWFKVVDKNTLKPLPNAAITLSNSQFAFSAVADTEGSVCFQNLEINEKWVTYTTFADYGDERIELPLMPSTETTIAMTAIAQGGLRGQRGDLSVTLQWHTIDDLDLHVKDPEGNQIYFSNDQVTAGNSFAQLDVDANRDSDNLLTDPQENIYWRNALTGVYRVFVHNYKSRTDLPVPFKIIVLTSTHREEVEGIIEPDSEAQLVVKFTYEKQA